MLNSFKKFNLYFIGISVLVIIGVLISPYIISFWIKEPLEIPRYLILLTGIVTLLRIYSTFYAFFLYGIGNLNTYIYILLISVIIKIPLSYYFVDLRFGINSVVISSIILMLFWISMLFSCSLNFLFHNLQFITHRILKVKETQSFWGKRNYFGNVSFSPWPILTFSETCQTVYLGNYNILLNT